MLIFSGLIRWMNKISQWVNTEKCHCWNLGWNMTIPLVLSFGASMKFHCIVIFYARDFIPTWNRLIWQNQIFTSSHEWGSGVPVIKKIFAAVKQHQSHCSWCYSLNCNSIRNVVGIVKDSVWNLCCKISTNFDSSLF